jgi:hypothetical protein
VESLNEQVFEDNPNLVHVQLLPGRIPEKPPHHIFHPIAKQSFIGCVASDSGQEPAGSFYISMTKRQDGSAKFPVETRRLLQSVFEYYRVSDVQTQLFEFTGTEG